MGQRAERIAREIQRSLSGELLAEIKDPRVSDAGFITVTQARVTDDLSIANVSVSLLGGDDKVAQALLAGLKSAAPYLRRQLGRMLNAKKIPELHFHLDRTDERAEKIDAIFRELEEERRKKGEPT